MQLKVLGTTALVAVTAFVIAIGSATTGEAKTKKKAAAAAPADYSFCPLHARAPVCATKGGQKFSYANACWASKDGAKVSKAGDCKPAKAAKKGGKKKMAKKKK